MIAKAKQFMKALVALAGVAANLIALGLVPTADVKWVTVAITLVTSLAVYIVPNSTAVTAAEQPHVAS